MNFVQDLQRLLRSGEQLPTLPTVVLQLHAVLDDEFATPAGIAAVIELDPAMTTRLLRAANSAAFSRSGERIASVTSAVQRLGVSQVRALCLVLAVVHAFEWRRGRLDHRSFWAHSASVGATARLLFSRVAQPAEGLTADDAYVAGLLHDVGLLMLDQFFPSSFGAVLAASEISDLPWHEHESEMLGMEHGDIGGLLLGCWGLPGGVVDSASFHHRLGELPREHRQICHVVQVAEAVCAHIGLGLDLEGRMPLDAASALAQLGIPDADIPLLLSDIADQATQARSLFA